MLVEQRPGPGEEVVVNDRVALINALGHTPVTGTRARIAAHDGHEICRVDVADAPGPV
ncbi:MAG: hypothetical protein ACRDYB_14105 [Acidimicrobiales bacterium]